MAGPATFGSYHFDIPTPNPSSKTGSIAGPVTESVVHVIPNPNPNPRRGGGPVTEGLDRAPSNISNLGSIVGGASKVIIAIRIIIRIRIRIRIIRIRIRRMIRIIRVLRIIRTIRMIRIRIIRIRIMIIIIIIMIIIIIIIIRIMIRILNMPAPVQHIVIHI
jgi:hypothetical protein